MNKTFVSILMIICVLVTLCACSYVDIPATSTKKFSAADGSFSITAPEDWSADKSEDDTVLSITDNYTGYPQIFFYSHDEGDDFTALDFTNEMRDYYGEHIIGEIKAIEVDGTDAYCFEYSMVDIGMDENEYNFHGYEYFVGYGDGVAEIDIYYSQTKLEGKLFNPSKMELELLRVIAQSIERY